MQPLPRALCAPLLYLAVIATLLPAEGQSAGFTGQLKFMSNYVYRGYSKSAGDPAYQANLDYEHDSGVFLGTWVSSVDFGEGTSESSANVEFMPYLGWSKPYNDDWRYDVMAMGYLYDGEVFGLSGHYTELSARLHFRDLISARYVLGIDAYGSDAEICILDLQARYPITDTLEVSATFGHEHGFDLHEYNYVFWNLGSTWYFHKNAAIDVRYYDSAHIDETFPPPEQMIELPEIDNHVVVSISVGF